MKFEQQMFSPIKNLFCDNYMICVEVPMAKKRIDIICERKDSGEIIAIEMKLSNWRKALKQAIVNQVGVNKSYVAISEKCAKNIDIELFRKYGVGLISVGEEAIIIEEAYNIHMLDNYYYHAIKECVRDYKVKGFTWH